MRFPFRHRCRQNIETVRYTAFYLNGHKIVNDIAKQYTF